jgi:radical SAM superfamily enzyme YgiQ (UPF0313 family)
MNILLITPPLTQLNTPYPSTTYLTGFLKSKGYNVIQMDLGIDLINRIFSRTTLETIFNEASENLTEKASQNVLTMFVQKQRYLQTIDAVMRFLQGKDETLATRICNGNFLPEASRFSSLTDVEWAFGNTGHTDKAKYLATLYIEDITDFICETICPNFELGRYAEHLSLYAPTFEPLKEMLNAPANFVDREMLSILKDKIEQVQPTLVGFSIPFPGNLYGALKCGQFIKMYYPSVPIAWGGGYVSTELRQLTDPSVFDYTDYILFDSGEVPLLRLIEVLERKQPPGNLIRTKIRNDANEVVSLGWEDRASLMLIDTGTPDYSGLPLHSYISLIETANPMHKLWSDGRWNKLTLANGCYWAKCAFCDTSLPYISCFDPGSASLLADRIEAVMEQTGTTGFHFVDEAAPPKVLRELSEEIIRRNLTISWWTNIRFEKAFTAELASLMARSGCIAVSGGIEVASNRLLKLMNKGVTIEQAATSAFHLTNNGIMVHAYLMYGFPTQNIQETIDGLEIVRQLFSEGLLQSAFWHRFAMTVHSPSGINPEKFGARHIDNPTGTFANNEIPFTDGQKLDLDMIGRGLRKATYNYMHNLCLDLPVSKWFEGTVPKPAIPSSYIRKHLQTIG